MARRICSMFLVLLLILPLLALPAKADVQDWIQLLDYISPNDDPSNLYRLTGTDNRITFDTPYANRFYTIDILIYITGTIPTGVNMVYTSRDPEEKAPLTMMQISSTTYRLYGSTLSYAVPYFDLEFVYANSNASSTVQFRSVRASTVTFTHYDIPASATIFDYSSSPARQYFTSYVPGQALTFAEWSPALVSNQSFRVALEVPSWQKYDYIDVFFSTFSGGVQSINVEFNMEKLPFEINWIGSSPDPVSLTVGCLRIDLTNLNRSISGDIDIVITGSSTANNTNNFAIQNVTGYVAPYEIPLLTYWFRQLQRWLDSGFQSVVDAFGGSGDASHVQDEISSAVGQLQQAGSAMDAVQRPDIGQVNIDVVGMVDPAGLTGLASLVGVITGNSLIYQIILMTLTLALISYILFGKR